MLWLVARLGLGYGWLNAGYQKLWGSEKAAFWNGGGAGVKGFATAGVADRRQARAARPTGGSPPSCTAIPCASWIAKLVTLSELVIGVLLILGLSPVLPPPRAWS